MENQVKKNFSFLVFDIILAKDYFIEKTNYPIFVFV